MTTRKEYIDKLRDLLDDIIVDGYIRTSDEWSAHNALQNDLHNLEKSFGYDLNNEENKET